MLYQFLANNRADLVARCVEKVAQRPRRVATEDQLKHGIPIFIDQLMKTLKAEKSNQIGASLKVSGASGGEDSQLSEIGISATAHGKELSRLGYSVDQVVHDYGDLCQAITDLAFLRDASFSIDEYRTLNRCLDNAIADAVSAFSTQRDTVVLEKQGTHENEQIGFLMHELRNTLGTANLALTAMELGNMSLKGATGAVLKRSHMAMARLVSNSLAEVSAKGKKAKPQPIQSLAVFIGDVKSCADLEATMRGCLFTVADVDATIGIDVNRDLLMAALMNLINNAFKFTHKHTEVRLEAYALGKRILIDVKDHCGGLPSGNAEKLFTPFSQRSNDRTGMGLGLTIARQSVEADGGILSVQDVPGRGCIFTINLPRYSLN